MRKHITKAERLRVEKKIQEGEDGYPNKKAAPPTVEAPAFAQAYRATGEGPRTKMKRYRDER